MTICSILLWKYRIQRIRKTRFLLALSFEKINSRSIVRTFGNSAPWFRVIQVAIQPLNYRQLLWSDIIDFDTAVLIGTFQYYLATTVLHINAMSIIESDNWATYSLEARIYVYVLLQTDFSEYEVIECKDMVLMRVEHSLNQQPIDTFSINFLRYNLWNTHCRSINTNLCRSM